MDKSLLRPKRIEWINNKGNKFVFIKIDENVYKEFIDGELAVQKSAVKYINPYIESERSFFAGYIKAFDIACFNEELESILYE